MNQSLVVYATRLFALKNRNVLIVILLIILILQPEAAGLLFQRFDYDKD